MIDATETVFELKASDPDPIPGQRETGEIDAVYERQNRNQPHP